MISITKNEEREFNSNTLSRLCGDEEWQDEYLDEIFCDYPDISGKFSFKDLSFRSKRDKPVILVYPKKMTIDEALEAEKLKYHTLSWEQERSLMIAIRNYLRMDKFFYSTTSLKPHKKISVKWMELDRPVDFYNFSFLCKWFKNINLESKVNNYIFVRIAGGEHLDRWTLNKDTYCADRSSELSFYIDDESPTKVELSKKFQKKLLDLMYFHPTLDLHASIRCRYSVFSEIYHSYRSFNANINNHSSISPKKRYYRAVESVRNLQALCDKQFLYTEDSNNIDYGKRNKTRNYYLARLLTIPAPNPDVLDPDQYGFRYPSEDDDIIENLRTKIQDNKCIDLSSLSYIKNVSFETWYTYYVFSRYICSYSNHSNNCTQFDRLQIDTAIKWMYTKISYKFFGCGSLLKDFYERFDSFGDEVVKRMEKNGHIFYDRVYAKNYINNMIKLILPTILVSHWNWSMIAEKKPCMLQANERCLFYTTRDGRMRPVLDGDYNSKCISSEREEDDVYTFGGKYSINIDTFDDQSLHINCIRNTMRYFDKTVDRIAVARGLLYEGLFPVFDKSRLSIVDLSTGEEVHCIIDLSKGVI